MIRGLYLSAVGMNMNILRQEIRANNLANTSTIGFARQVEHLGSMEAHSGRASNVTGPVPRLPIPFMIAGYTDMARGSFQETGNPLDVTVMTDGFIEVGQGADRRYQRTASLQVSDGVLVTGELRPVMGSNGPIDVDVPVRELSIGRNGEVMVNGTVVDNLRIVRQAGANGTWLKAEDGGFVPQGMTPVVEDEPQVDSGVLEQSNVNGISEMVGMISLYRHFEAGQKAIRAIDETLEKAVTEVGSTR